MSRIRGKDTGPELILRNRLHRMGYRYRLHSGNITGRPDIAFPRLRLAIFVNGCFWHGCPRHYVAPQTNSSFWRGKLQQNRKRDVARRRMLRREGWTVLEFWEHEVEAHPELCVAEIEAIWGRLRPASPRLRVPGTRREAAERHSRSG